MKRRRGKPGFKKLSFGSRFQKASDLKLMSVWEDAQLVALWLSTRAFHPKNNGFTPGSMAVEPLPWLKEAGIYPAPWNLWKAWISDMTTISWFWGDLSRLIPLKMQSPRPSYTDSFTNRVSKLFKKWVVMQNNRYPTRTKDLQPFHYLSGCTVQDRVHRGHQNTNINRTHRTLQLSQQRFQV